MTEDYSLESLKGMWASYLQDHDLKGEILDISATYPEVQHLEIDHGDVSMFNMDLADYLLENPRASLMAAEATVQEAQPPTSRVPIRVVITELPELNKRRPIDLRVADLGHLVAVGCMVGTPEPPTARFAVAVFQCMRCGAIHRVEQNTPGKRKDPIECYKENGGCTRAATSTKFRVLTTTAEMPDPFAMTVGDHDLDMSEMTDEQWMDVQDSPESLRGNEMPALLKVRLEGHRLVRKANPGDRVTLLGILRVDDGKGTVSPDLYFDVNHLVNHTQDMLVVTDEDADRLRAIVAGYKDPLSMLLVPSLAPHVYGMVGPKHGIICQLLGGLAGKVGSKTLRWMMHLLLVGDPGTGKSLLLKHVSKLIPKGTYVDAGKASRAGLVAKAEQINGKWMAVPGYVVRSHGSVCCVDELNKMKADDIAMLNEVMESGEANLAKAGGGTFPAETAILAAMNPKSGGKYAGDFHGEVEIEGATLSRFALIYVITDSKDVDDGLQGLIRPYYTDGVLEEGEAKELLSTEDMRKLVAVARPLKPKLTPEAAQMVDDQHKTLRNAQDSSWSNRVLEDLYRLSVSVAKARLSEIATIEDVQKAIDIHSMAAWGEIHGTGDVMQIEYVPMGGSQEEKTLRVLNQLAQLDSEDQKEGVEFKVLAKECTNLSLDELGKIMKRLSTDGRVYEIRPSVWKVVR